MGLCADIYTNCHVNAITEQFRHQVLGQHHLPANPLRWQQLASLLALQGGIHIADQVNDRPMTHPY